MARIARHDNIVNLQGIAEWEDQVLLIMEFCALGSVESFLKKNANHYIECLKNRDYDFFLSCCSQVVDGMIFLVDKGIMHRDLAARNILITSDMVVKIADFGLSYRTYLTPGHGGMKTPKSELVPVPYSAYEVLIGQGAVLQYSDIWSFAVFVWELFQVGRQMPYYNVTGGKF